MLAIAIMMLSNKYKQYYMLYIYINIRFAHIIDSYKLLVKTFIFLSSIDIYYKNQIKT